MEDNPASGNRGGTRERQALPEVTRPGLRELEPGPEVGADCRSVFPARAELEAGWGSVWRFGEALPGPWASLPAAFHSEREGGARWASGVRTGPAGLRGGASSCAWVPVVHSRARLHVSSPGRGWGTGARGRVSLRVQVCLGVFQSIRVCG